MDESTSSTSVLYFYAAIYIYNSDSNVLVVQFILKTNASLLIFLRIALKVQRPGARIPVNTYADKMYTLNKWLCLKSPV